MLHELKMLAGSSVTATDGEIGCIRTFLFDDQSWMVHYVAVEVGHWAGRRDVVIAVSAIDQPNWSSRSFRVRMTKQQVSESPDIDTEKPVTFQQRIAMEKYFGRFACWVDEEFGMSSIPTGVEYPIDGKEDPHLRSTEDMLGYEVWAADGDMGRLEGFVVDEATWHLGYLDVQAGGWLRDRSVLVPTRWVHSVSWADHRIYVHDTREIEEVRRPVATTS
jgi:PRC-barrel domain